MNIGRRQFLGATLGAGMGLALSPRMALAAAGPQCPGLLHQARAALDRHAGRIANRNLVGLVDFSARSGTPRFHLVDMAGGQFRRSLLVAHGRGSDPANSGLVQLLSNRPGSNASCGGAFVTGQTYFGQHGRSRQLHGLEPENDQAFARAIVIHGADYVDRDMATSQGRVGRSLGCFAFERRTIDEVLDLLGPGHLLFAAR